ncbi:MAG TPA: hypothetical protein VNR62_02585, partial [Cellulomonas sp.]|nr:hypothetical protein [Cellulomonas sp.]
TEQWDSLSDPECVFCESAREATVERADQHQHNVGGAITIETIKTRAVVPGKSWLSRTEVVQAPLAVADKTGKVISDYSLERRTPANFVVHWDDGDWILREVDFQADVK